jgi:hypothetical protein
MQPDTPQSCHTQLCNPFAVRYSCGGITGDLLSDGAFYKPCVKPGRLDEAAATSVPMAPSVSIGIGFQVGIVEVEG